MAAHNKLVVITMAVTLMNTPVFLCFSVASMLTTTIESFGCSLGQMGMMGIEWSHWGTVTHRIWSRVGTDQKRAHSHTSRSRNYAVATSSDVVRLLQEQ